MRKRLIASLFIAFLFCAPVLAGHVNIGGHTEWCECGSFEACICDPGEQPVGLQLSSPEVVNESSQETPIGLGSEMLFALAALVLVLRYKA